VKGIYDYVSTHPGIHDPRKSEILVQDTKWWGKGGRPSHLHARTRAGAPRHSKCKHRPGAVGDGLSNLQFTLPPSMLQDTTPAHNPQPHSVDDYMFRNTKQRGEGEGVRGCVGQNLHPAYSLRSHRLRTV